jgi:PAS domain-containing protein
VGSAPQPSSRRPLGAAALGIAILGTRLTWPLLERAPLLLLFCAILASSHLLTETAGLVVIILAMFGAAQVVPPGGPPIADSSIITFLAASVFFNRLIVRRNQALAALRVEGAIPQMWQHAAAGRLLDHRGHVERFNPAMERILGIPRTPGAASRSATSFIATGHRSPRALQQLMAGEAPASVRSRARHQDESSIVAHVTLTPILDASGRRCGACRVRGHHRARRRRRLGRRANRRPWGFTVTGAVHVRNLLTSIGGYGGLLASGSTHSAKISIRFQSGPARPI